MGTLIRTLSFFEQWAAEVIRQPGLMFTLVLAPFLLLFAFGEGVDIGGTRPRTLIVQEAGAEMPIEPLLKDLDHEVNIVGVTSDEFAARRSLERGEIDAVAIVPADPQSYIESQQQVPLLVLLREIDPVRRSYATSYLKDQIAALNQRAIEVALAEGQSNMADTGLPDVDPAVLSAPFVLEVEDVTPVAPGFTSFYAPSVLALLVQHLAVTLAALTIARMRLLGLTDLLRVAPVSNLEIILGNYASYGALCALAAGALLVMLVLILGVPVVGSYLMVALILGLLTLCALGIGFLASQLSTSVQQASQIAMLVLLASVFFGGFAFSLDRITWPFRAISEVLPVSYAIRSLQDVMLRGFDPEATDLLFLTSMGVSLLVLNVLLLRSRMKAR